MGIQLLVAFPIAFLLFVGVCFSDQHSSSFVNADRNAYVADNRIYWLHIEKTSSWLGDFLLFFACPKLLTMFKTELQHRSAPFIYDRLNPYFEKDNYTTTNPFNCTTEIVPINKRYGYHDPYDPNIVKGITVTMFRDPAERLISAFLFNDGVMLPPGFRSKFSRPEVKKHVRSAPVPIIEYANTPGIASCQTKMVMRQECGTPVNMSSADVTEAKRRIKNDFKFIGITEESRATAELFYKMFGKIGNQVPPHDFQNRMYRQNTQHTVEKNSELLHILRSHNWHDDADTELYRHARSIFYSRCQQYNVSVNHKP